LTSQHWKAVVSGEQLRAIMALLYNFSEMARTKIKYMYEN
jgi:hypothetical protein